jgi:hypothetical protein
MLRGPFNLIFKHLREVNTQNFPTTIDMLIWKSYGNLPQFIIMSEVILGKKLTQTGTSRMCISSMLNTETLDILQISMETTGTAIGYREVI